MSDISSSWQATNLERETVDGFVYAASFIVEATDGINSTALRGTVNFSRPETLVPYESLQKEQVVQWIKDAIGADKVLEIGQVLLDRINEQRNPTKANGLPWSN